MKNKCSKCIDSNGNYEPGNIQFITEKEHVKIHRGVAC